MPAALLSSFRARTGQAATSPALSASDQAFIHWRDVARGGRMDPRIVHALYAQYAAAAAAEGKNAVAENAFGDIEGNVPIVFGPPSAGPFIKGIGRHAGPAIANAVVAVTTGGPGLNLRAAPGVNAHVVRTLPNGTMVRVLREGIAEQYVGGPPTAPLPGGAAAAVARRLFRPDPLGKVAFAAAACPACIWWLVAAPNGTQGYVRAIGPQGESNLRLT